LITRLIIKNLKHYRLTPSLAGVTILRHPATKFPHMGAQILMLTVNYPTIGAFLAPNLALSKDIIFRQTNI